MKTNLLPRMVILLASMAWTLSALAVPMITGPTTSEGDYTLSWSLPECQYGTDNIILHENGGITYEMGCEQSKAFTLMPDGVYEYTLESCSYNPYVGTICIGIGYYDPHTVTVSSSGGGATGLEDEPPILGATLYGKMNYSSGVGQSGAATVSIPIDVPKGVTPAATPGLSLSYNSFRAASLADNTQPESILGYGWDLNGLSAIRRCEQKNPAAPSLDFSLTDRLCLDGELLILTSGAYWSVATYRLETDNFTKIVATGAGVEQAFTVYKQDGTIYRYGKTSASRSLAAGTTVPYQWALEEIDDRHGNIVSYTYAKDESIGEIYPLGIDYGGYAIEFEYALRSGTYPRFGYFGSVYIERKVYLHTIRTVVNGTPAREYRLDSNYESNRMLLRQVQVCGFSGGSPSCLGPMQVTWTTVGSNVGVSQITDNVGAYTRFFLATQLTYEPQTIPPQIQSYTTCNGVAYVPPQGSAASLFATRLEKFNGLTGGLSSWDYAAAGYGGSSTNRRGFLGLDGRRIKDNQTGNYTYVFQHTCFPYTGMTAAVYEYDGAVGTGTLLEKRDYKVNYVYPDYGFPIVFPYVSEAMTMGYENGVQFGASKVVNNYYLSNGVLTSKVSTTQVGNTGTQTGTTWTVNSIEKTEVETTTFQNDVTNWLLHFPSNISITHSAAGEPAGFTQVTTASQVSGSLLPNLVTRDPGTDTELNRQYAYNMDGTVSSITTWGSSITSRTESFDNYVDSRYPTSMTNAEGHVTTMSYNLVHGKVSSVTDANSLTTTTTFDPLGRQLTIDYPDSRYTTITYADCSACGAVQNQRLSLKVSIASVSEPSREIYYDKLGRQVRTKVKSLAVSNWSNVDTTYDASGRVAQKSEPYFGGTGAWTTYTYDRKHRPEYIDPPSGDQHYYTYSIVSNVFRVQDRVSATYPTEYQYTYKDHNALGQVVGSYDGEVPDQVHTAYDYTSNGWLDSVQVNANVSTLTTTTMTYDRAGNRLSITEPNTGTTTFDFDALGQVLSQTDAASRTIANTYDKLGRVKTRNDNGVMNYWYYDPANAKGQLLSKSTTNFSESYSYDGYARLTGISTSITYPVTTANFTLAQTYDAYSRPTTTTFPSGLIERYSYNSYGYLYLIQNSSNTDLHKVTALSPYGQPVSETFNNGTSKSTTVDNNSGRITAITQTNLPNLAYVWRNHGHLYQRQRGSTTETFSYDGNNRLTQAAASTGRTLTYDNDALGNLLYIDSNIGSDADANAMTYGSGGAGVHGLKQGYYGGVVHTFNYDAVGNVTSINAATGNATFAYDAQNRATSLSKGVTTQTFAYEPNGQRFYQYQSSTNEHTFYLYGGVYQDTRIGAAGTGYRKTQVTDAVQHTKDPTGVEQYLYFRRDGLGSIDAILNSAGGVVDTLGYDPYGSRRMSDWSADINSTELNEILNNANMRTKRGFTDHEHLDLVDVVHMNGRIYDPRFGRFLNADPIVVDPFNSQAHNRYAYVRGSPLSRTDPSGFAEDDPIEEVVVEGRRAPDDPRWNIDHGADLSPESLSASVGGIVYTPFFWIQGADGTPGVIVYGKKPAQPSGNPFAHPVGGLAVAEVDSYPIRVNPATGCYVWDGQCAAFKQVGGGGGEVKQFLQSCSGEVATCVAQKVGEATAVGMVIGLPTKGVEKLSESLAKDNFSTSIRKIRGMSKLVAPISTGATVIQLPVFYQYCTLMSPACSEGGAHD